MARTIGKQFEDNVKDSCPDWLLVYRPPDAAQAFNMSSELRFSRHSPADFFFHHGESGFFYAVECKTFKGSCSFERTEDDKGIIHLYQIESLIEFFEYENVISGFLLDFRKSGNTYFLFIDEFVNMIDSISKKSFTEQDMLRYCSPIIIGKKKLKVNYRYDIEQFLINAENYILEKRKEK